MKRFTPVLGILAVLLTSAQAAAPSRQLVILTSEDEKVCEHFRTHHETAPIKWQTLPQTPEAENYRAVFDFENTGKPMEVRRREDLSFVFGGTYFAVAPQGYKISPDWFEQIDPSKGFLGLPEPMRMYVQEDMNASGEVARFNDKYYVRTVPMKESLNYIMILEPKDGKLHELCRYQVNK